MFVNIMRQERIRLYSENLFLPSTNLLYSPKVAKRSTFAFTNCQAIARQDSLNPAFFHWTINQGSSSVRSRNGDVHIRTTYSLVNRQKTLLELQYATTDTLVAYLYDKCYINRSSMATNRLHTAFPTLTSYQQSHQLYA